MRALLKHAKPIALALALILAMLPALADVNTFQTGKLQGSADAKGKGSKAWFLAGCFLDLIGVGAAYLIVPDPPAESLMGKSSEYVMGYTEGYKDTVRSEDTKYALYGFGTEVAVSLLASACYCCCVVVVVGGTASSSSSSSY